MITADPNEAGGAIHLTGFQEELAGEFDDDDEGGESSEGEFEELDEEEMNKRIVQMKNQKKQPPTKGLKLQEIKDDEIPQEKPTKQAPKKGKK